MSSSLHQWRLRKQQRAAEEQARRDAAAVAAAEQAERAADERRRRAEAQAALAAETHRQTMAEKKARLAALRAKREAEEEKRRARLAEQAARQRERQAAEARRAEEAEQAKQQEYRAALLRAREEAQRALSETFRKLGKLLNVDELNEIMKRMYALSDVTMLCQRVRAAVNEVRAAAYSIVEGLGDERNVDAVDVQLHAFEVSLAQMCRSIAALGVRLNAEQLDGTVTVLMGIVHNLLPMARSLMHCAGATRSAVDCLQPLQQLNDCADLLVRNVSAVRRLLPVDARGDRAVRLFSPAHFAVRMSAPLTCAFADTCSWSRDGTTLAIGGARAIALVDRGSLDVFDSRTLFDADVYDVPRIDALRWSPDSRYVAARIGERGHVELRSRANPSWFARIDAHKLGVVDVDWAPNGRQLVTSSAERLRSVVWSLVAGDEPRLQHMERPALFARASHRFAPNGEHVALLERRGSADCVSIFACHTTLWQLANHVCLQTMSASELHWSPDSRFVAVRDCAARCCVVVINALSGKVHATYDDVNDSLTCVAWSYDSRSLALGCGDGTVRVLSIDALLRADFQCDLNETLVAGSETVMLVERALTDDNKSSVLLFEAAPQGRTIAGTAAPRHQVAFRAVRQLRWSPDSRRIAVRCDTDQQLVFVVDVAEQRVRHVLFNRSPVRDMAWSNVHSPVEHLAAASNNHKLSSVHTIYAPLLALANDSGRLIVFTGESAFSLPSGLKRATHVKWPPAVDRAAEFSLALINEKHHKATIIQLAPTRKK